MTDRESLLNQLRLEREQPAAVPRARRTALAVGAAAVGIAAAAFATVRLVNHPVEQLSSGAAAAEETAPPASPSSAAAPAASILDASGYVVARRQATVSAKITGKVVAVLIEEGRRVEAGDIIARLDDANARAQVAEAAAQVEQQRANLTAARVAFENAVPTFNRNRSQFAAAFISAQLFDEAKASYDAARTNLDVASRALEVAKASLAVTQRNLEDTVVRAPFAGIVTVKAAQEGEVVSPVSAGGGFTRTGIGTIVDMNSLEVEVDVSESFISRVQTGQPVAITLNAYPDRRIPGHVVAIIPTADRAKATVKVRIGFAERDAAVLPEMGARVAFLRDDNSAAATE
ncbi:MAG TPA: efflux RND transporter periplasmic adaptor subunit [Gammaproteobacteria bacterium]